MAKPILDIDIVFYDSTTFTEVNRRLEVLGYYHIGDLEIEDREVFKRDNRLKDHPVLDSIKHHLYVCPSYSKELQRHIIFRDYLRENELERIEYEKLKLSIAEKANQVHENYAKLKETMAKEFIESILEKA